MSEELVVTAKQKDAPIAVVMINRPKALNALNIATVGELLRMTTELEIDDEVRVVILTGSGEKAFVAGADIAEMQAMGPRDAHRFAETGQALMSAIEASHKVWIAAVNGFALGGGCELALACDFIYMAATAKIGQPEVNLGVIPGFGGTQRLLRRVGIAKARELIFTGDAVSADEAMRIGLADAVVAPGELLAKAHETGRKIAGKAPLAIAEAKRAMLEGQGLPLDQACSLEGHAFASLFDTLDQREGMKAFLEKRPAKFRGE